MRLTKCLFFVISFLFILKALSAQNKENPSKEEVFTELKQLKNAHKTIQSWHLSSLEGKDLDDELFNFLADVFKTQRLFNSRRKIVHIVTKDKIISIDKKVTLFLWGIEEECTFPLTRKEQETDIDAPSCSPSEVLNATYRGGLIALGASVVPLLKDELKKNKSLCVRENLVVGLGWFKDLSIFKNLLWLLNHSPNGFTRAGVARVIEAQKVFQTKEAISSLKEALNDPFKLVCDGDVNYLVRASACDALNKLGIFCMVDRKKGAIWLKENGTLKRVY